MLYRMYCPVHRWLNRWIPLVSAENHHVYIASIRLFYTLLSIVRKSASWPLRKWRMVSSLPPTRTYTVELCWILSGSQPPDLPRSGRRSALSSTSRSIKFCWVLPGIHDLCVSFIWSFYSNLFASGSNISMPRYDDPNITVNSFTPGGKLCIS